MNATLAMVTIGVVPVSEVLPLLTEHISEDRITHISLLASRSREEVMAEYGMAPGDDPLYVLLSDDALAEVSHQKIERALQATIEVLDNQGFDVIMLMSTLNFSHLIARNAILLEPVRIIPPLIASIVNGQQVGIILPIPEHLKLQERKWAKLEKPPVYALANPFYGTEDEWLRAGQSLTEQGAEVLLLDCLGFHQRHRDLLQKHLEIPVLLTNVLVSRLAAELLV
ncbi:AroM family protein [Siccibacter turicensis]|uniref:AroM family protein n=1 Tax=Siccibacter turicensis TaxID=357233 RepID=UPI003F54772B